MNNLNLSSESVPAPATKMVSRAQLLQRGRRLEYLTLAWNVLEGGVSITAGVLAGSVALIGFGVDSFIESLSGAVLLWRLRDGEVGESREPIALRLVGMAFLVLAAYIAFDAGSSLLRKEAPEISWLGVGMTTLSVFVMPFLARAKRRTGQLLGSRALEADSRQTDICVYLSIIVLAGLILNAFFGWWWADSVAALAMTPIIVKEGWQSWQGQSCGCHASGAACESEENTHD